jgi:hypothetical protein
MLEYAVRPYQTPGSQGKIIIPSTPGSSSQRATITWSAQSSVTPQNNGFNVTCCGEHLDELTREYEVVQIPVTQAQVDEGHLDVARSNKLTLHKKLQSNKCDSPLDQYLGAEFGLDDTGDVFVDLGWAGTPDADTDQCRVTWALNNNTTGA